MRITKEESRPQNIRHIDLTVEEMMFIMYMPIKMPGMNLSESLKSLPENLKFLDKLLAPIWVREQNINFEDYVYVTVKHTHVSPNSMSQRPGWHIDSFGTNDINYIWYSEVPTEFCIQDFDISDNDSQSIKDMEVQAKSENIHTFGRKRLIRLDNKVVHRVSENTEYTGMRTFIKVSISKHKYNLKGNAKNYNLDYNWKMYPREELRNMEHNKDFI